MVVFSDDQVESRLWWVAGGSSHTFVAESPDECARAVVGVTPQSGLFPSSLFSFSSLLSLFVSFISSSLLFASAWRVLCCVVLCCACLCVSLCYVSGVEQCVQVKGINEGLGNVLFSTCSQTENR